MGDTRLEPVVLSEAERLTLESWAKRRSTAQGLAVRAHIVLACANGWNNTAVAARFGVGRDTVRRWRTRFLARRLDGLADEPRPGCQCPKSSARVTSAFLVECTGSSDERDRRRPQPTRVQTTSDISADDYGI